MEQRETIVSLFNNDKAEKQKKQWQGRANRKGAVKWQGNAYPTNHLPTPATRANHISCTSTDFAAGDTTDLDAVLTIRVPDIVARMQSAAESLSRIRVFVLAAQSSRDEEFAVLQEVRANLATGSRQLRESGEVEIGSEEADDAVVVG